MNLDYNIKRNRKRGVFWEARKYFLIPGVLHRNPEEERKLLDFHWQSKINEYLKKKGKKEISVIDGRAYSSDDQGRLFRASSLYDIPKGWWACKESWLDRIS